MIYTIYYETHFTVFKEWLFQNEQWLISPVYSVSNLLKFRVKQNQGYTDGYRLNYTFFRRTSWDHPRDGSCEIKVTWILRDKVRRCVDNGSVMTSHTDVGRYINLRTDEKSQKRNLKNLLLYLPISPRISQFIDRYYQARILPMH